jgi:ribosome biogenesis SPOUT family RNA methylase Rps3
MEIRTQPLKKGKGAVANRRTRIHLTERSRGQESKMSQLGTVHFKVDVASDVAELVTNAASARNITAADVINECISQHFELALRHRVLIQRQDDVDEAILELARLVGRLSAGPVESSDNVCRYHVLAAE